MLIQFRHAVALAALCSRERTILTLVAAMIPLGMALGFAAAR